jgi:hypothetical protein
LEITLNAVYLPKYKKKEFIEKASNKIDFIKYLIRLAYETKSLNLKKYLILEEKILEIGRMIGGWLKLF